MDMKPRNLSLTAFAVAFAGLLIGSPVPICAQNPTVTSADSSPPVTSSETSGPLAILKQVKRVQFGEDGKVVEPVQAEPADSPPLSVSGEPPVSAAPPSSAVPSYAGPALVEADAPLAKDAPRPSRVRETQETPRAGLIRGIIGKVPLIGPRLTGGPKEKEPPPFRKPDFPSPPSPPDDDEDAVPPVLYPPPAETAETSPGLMVSPGAPILKRPELAREPGIAGAPDRGTPHLGPSGLQSLPDANRGGILIQPAQVPQNAGSGIAPVVTPANAGAVPVVQPEPSSPATTETSGFQGIMPIQAPPTVPPVHRSVATTPTLAANDLAMPNPAAEPNEINRADYASALGEAREGRFALAAKMFRDYAGTHPSSRLAPRALFLSALVEPNPALAAESVALLNRFYPRSDYLTELGMRGISVQGGTEDPVQKVGRLERELATTIDVDTVSRLRSQLGAAYLELKDYQRALEVLRAIPDASAKPDVLDQLAECHMALGDHRSAALVIEELLRNHPLYPGRAKLRLSLGLIQEDAGLYQRAMAEYRLLLEEAPNAPEAGTARERMNQLKQLTQ